MAISKRKLKKLIKKEKQKRLSNKEKAYLYPDVHRNPKCHVIQKRKGICEVHSFYKPFIDEEEIKEMVEKYLEDTMTKFTYKQS